MVLFICSTPYHIYSVVNLAKTKFSKDEKDIYILDHSTSNYEIFLKLKDENIFNNVLYLKTKHLTGGGSNSRTIRYINTFRHYINSSYVNEQILNDKVYDSIFISSPDVASQLIYYYYKNKCNKTQLYMYEDGTFAYNYFDVKYSSLKRWFLKLRFGSDITTEYCGAYVYRPEFMKKKNNVNIFSIPRIDKNNSEMITLLNKIMGYQPVYIGAFDIKYVFFDQAFQFEKIIDEGKDILENITNIIGKDNMVVKLHPRTSINSHYADYNIMNLNVPYEIISLNNNVKDKVLVSISSTACFNPKIIYDEEPFVILLYKLIDFTGIPNYTSETAQLAEKVKLSYSNSNRFCIPETKEELQEILSNLTEGPS